MNIIDIWFEYTFDLDNEQSAELDSVQSAAQAKIINLIFDGMNTISEIYFNNESIGHSDNMFIQWKFRITSSFTRCEQFTGGSYLATSTRK